MENKAFIFTCRNCGKMFQASRDEYKTNFWHGEVYNEGYCPYCGEVNNVKTTNLHAGGSGGGKF